MLWQSSSDNSVFVLVVCVICVKSLVFLEADASLANAECFFTYEYDLSLERSLGIAASSAPLSCVPPCRGRDYEIALSPTVHDNAVFINEQPAQPLSVPPEYEISSSLCHACLTSPRPVVILSFSFLLLLPSLSFPTRTWAAHVCDQGRIKIFSLSLFSPPLPLSFPISIVVC